MVILRPRVAILGGDGRFRPESLPACRVIVLSRWNGHAATRRITRLCKTCGVTVKVRP